MTEEIIIDGIDVAGCHNKTPYKNDYGDVQCKCYRFEDIENNTFLLGICKQHPNCYYKQLKRLEQENKELKIKLSSTKCYLCGEGFLTPEGAELYEEKNSYRSALEEIQKAIKSYDLDVDNGASVDTLYTIRKIINEVLQ